RYCVRLRLTLHLTGSCASLLILVLVVFFFSSRRRHTRCYRDWSSDVCSSDLLVDAGLEVVPIHPNALKASRPRYSAAGGKSDPGDAFILADVLRTDGHRFRPLRPPSDDTRALRALVRGRDDLMAQRVALANQLRALLERFWPGAAAIFADVDSPIALAFLTRYPTPHSAARLGEARLAQFLGQQGYSGRRPVAELLARLRRAPVSQVGATEAEASGEVVGALVAVLTPL